jgi:hypothetical protein
MYQHVMQSEGAAIAVIERVENGFIIRCSEAVPAGAFGNASVNVAETPRALTNIIDKWASDQILADSKAAPGTTSSLG